MILMTKICQMCGKVFDGRQQKYCGFQCSWKAKQEKSARKPKKRKETLCWTCKNACGGCSWSQSFTPVEGWDATETVLKCAEGEETSYFVSGCPLYIIG